VALFFFLTLVPLRVPSDAKFPGDDEFVRGEYANAVAAYDSVITTGNAQAQALWRLARVHVCLADVADHELKELLYRKAEKYARECISTDSTLSEGHSWLAVALGNIATFQGSKTKVELCNEIKFHLDRAIALNPSDDVAYSILGSFYLALGNVSWLERQLASLFLGSLPDGGYDDARRALQTAIRLAPNVIRHHYELATTYRLMGRTEDAVAEYKVSVELPPMLASDPRTQQRAREWIERLVE
jgi:tetratricopeptide (TPR) repeat protein